MIGSKRAIQYQLLTSDPVPLNAKFYLEHKLSKGNVDASRIAPLIVQVVVRRTK